MDKRILFIIESDPRSSHRPAEAARMAAGVAVWKQAEVSLYFRGAATLALTDETETLVDGDHLARHLALLREAGGRVAASGQMSDAELAAWMAEQTTVARF